MSAAKHSPRLLKLDHILQQSPPTGGRGSAADVSHQLLASVPLERIHALANELSERPDGADDLDALAMRILLNEYKAAVATLRAVTNQIDARLHTAAGQLDRHRKAVRREEEMAIKRGERPR